MDWAEVTLLVNTTRHAKIKVRMLRKLSMYV